MAALEKLEKQLDEVFGRKSSLQIPENWRKVIVEWLPWLSLIAGIIMFWNALNLWRWAHVASELSETYSRIFGVRDVHGRSMTLWLWVGLIVLVVQGLLHLMAFSPLKGRNKKGWDLLFYSALLSLAYAIVVFFGDYGSLSNLAGSLIGGGIGLFILFQIRDSYSGRTRSSVKPAGSKAGTSSK